MLNNVVRHVDAHNKAWEEDEMWRLRETEEEEIREPSVRERSRSHNDRSTLSGDVSMGERKHAQERNGRHEEDGHSRRERRKVEDDTEEWRRRENRHGDRPRGREREHHGSIHGEAGHADDRSKYLMEGAHESSLRVGSKAAISVKMGVARDRDSLPFNYWTRKLMEMEEHDPTR